MVALGVPLVSIAAQFPLWLARQWLGWRLVREETAAAPLREPPLAIRDLMVATLVVAVSLALARVAPSPDAGQMWPVWAFAFVVASVVSTIAMLPAGKLLLRSDGSVVGGLELPLRGGWIALVWIVVAVLRWFGVGLPPWQLFVGLSSLMLTLCRHAHADGSHRPQPRLSIDGAKVITRVSLRHNLHWNLGQVRRPDEPMH